MAQRSQHLLLAWYLVNPSILHCWPKFVQRWGLKHYLASVEIMHPSSTKLLAPTQDRCVSTSLPINHRGSLTDGSKIEAARTIWWLLHDSKLAVSDEKDVTIDQDQGELRQDRYPLRTAPQFLGPQIEDILASMNSIQIECNSSTSIVQRRF